MMEIVRDAMLKYFYLFLSAAGSVCLQTCNTIVTRQEIRTLSPCQLTKYFNAIKQLKNEGSFYLQSTAIHYDNAPYAHGVPAFFPWHRQFLRNYEMALQAIDPSIVLPYWDWTIDSQAPEKSPVLSNDYFGGNGRSSDNCVVQGPFAGWNSTIPEPRCLKRQYNAGNKITAFYSPEAVEVLLSQALTYDQLQSSIEPGPHSAVHDGIGGNNGDMAYMYSPNDPIFYSHHAFVDLLWSEWQMRNPSLANSYTGSSSENMIPFDAPVSSVFNTTAPGFCYAYPRWNATLPTVQPPCQAKSSQNSISNTTTSEVQTREYLASRRRKALNDIIASFKAQAKNPIKVSPTDRTSQGKIRTPAPLPDKLIAMNKLDSIKVREDEQVLARLVETLNGVSNFVPSANI